MPSETGSIWVVGYGRMLGTAQPSCFLSSCAGLALCKAKLKSGQTFDVGPLPSLLYLGLICIMFYLINHYTNRFRMIIKPLSYISISPNELGWLIKDDFPNNKEGVTNAESASSLVIALGVIQIIDCAIKNIHKFSKLSVHIIYIIGVTMTTWFVSILGVTLINYAVYKIDKTNSIIDKDYLANWFIYSASSMVFSLASSIKYNSQLSGIVFFFSGFLGIAFFSLFIVIVISVIKEKGENSIREYIGVLDDYKITLEGNIGKIIV